MNRRRARRRGGARRRYRSLRDDDDRTRRVLDAVLADRTEDHPGERAVPTTADHERLGALPGVAEHLGRMALHDLRKDGDRSFELAGDLGDRLVKELGHDGGDAVAFE